MSEPTTTPAPEVPVERRDVLPDSRARETRQRIFTPAGTYVPFFCANCGKECGSCPEDNTFLFYLCPNCEKQHGPPAGLYRLPDEVYWEKLRQEQLAHFGYYPTQEELSRVLAEDASPLATLLKEAK